jgi:peroxiredoxin
MDSVESHKGFAEKKQLPLTLLSDAEGEVTAKYNVKSWLPAARPVRLLSSTNRARSPIARSKPVSLFRSKDDDVLAAIRSAQKV